jgi:putative ABC transport system permease protein
MGLMNALPGAVAQGLIWGIMAIGVYITFKILDLADLTVDGSMVTGMAVCAMLMAAGWNVWLAMLVAIVAGMAAGLVTGIFHTVMGIPAILSGILTQLILWSVNLKIMGKANQALPARIFDVLITQLYVYKALVILALFCIVLVAV